MPALFEAMDKVLDAQAERIAIPRRFEATIKEIWSLQPRFEQRAGQRPFRLLEHPRFRAAYDFLVLRGESGEVPQALVDWWTRFQERPTTRASDAEARRGAEEAPPHAQPQARADKRDDARAAPPTNARRMPARCLRRPRQQPRPSAPPARAALATARATRGVRVLAVSRTT